MMRSLCQQIGPGALVAAAFIGPGTVTTATLAGATYGYALLWTLVFATAATIILQEMAARLGLISGKGLGQTLADLLTGSLFKWPVFLLVGIALYMGNAAYEAGNLSGAALGVAAVMGDNETVFATAVLFISVVAALLLWKGSYLIIERVMTLLVAVMALSFIGSFLVVGADVKALSAGLVTPSIPSGALTTVIALIGTTVVPYNLFLHAAAVREKYAGAADLPAARADTVVAISVGGLVTVVIVATAAASLFVHGISVESAADMARQLEPLFGSLSTSLLGVGFFAAGLTSAIAAPLATSYAVTELAGLQGVYKQRAGRWVMLSVIVVGAALALSGTRPLTIIVTAQFANGLLLPLVAAVVLYALNQKALLGPYANGWRANLMGVAVLLVALGLGMRSALRASGLL